MDIATEIPIYSPPAPGRRRIGLALSGGAVRGFAHIGVLKAFDRCNIPVDVVAGTSAGAVIGALFACGCSPRELQAMAETTNFDKLIDLRLRMGDLVKRGIQWLMRDNFRFCSLFPMGLLKGERTERLLAGLTQGKRLADTTVPVAITAVDLLSGDTVFFVTPAAGRRIILNARYDTGAALSTALRASISLPGLFEPLRHQNMLLVDGAVKNNLPTDILRHLGADVVVAVDLGYSGQPLDDVRTLGELLLHCVDIMGREVTLMKAEQYASVIIRPCVSDFHYNDHRAIRDCILQGEAAAMERIEEIRALL